MAVLEPNIEVIASKRLRLIKPAHEHVSCFYKWNVSNANTDSYLSAENVSEEEIKQRIECDYYWSETSKYYVICHGDSVRPIGYIHYWFDPAQYHVCEIGIKIANISDRNKGFGTEAQATLISALFGNTTVETIEMYTDVDNAAEQACLSKLGFDFVKAVQFHDFDKCRVGRLYRLTQQMWFDHNRVTL